MFFSCQLCCVDTRISIQFLFLICHVYLLTKLLFSICLQIWNCPPRHEYLVRLSIETSSCCLIDDRCLMFNHYCHSMHIKQDINNLHISYQDSHFVYHFKFWVSNFKFQTWNKKLQKISLYKTCLKLTLSIGKVLSIIKCLMKRLVE